MTNLYDLYNPLDYENLTLNLVRELLAREALKLPLCQKFQGQGVYALFYGGEHPAYKTLDLTLPIYAGKAVEGGARKGKVSMSSRRSELYDRVREHVRTIEQSESLELADFRVRLLVVTPLWITMAERFLIEHFQPLWNVCVDGFGNHDPGKGRYRGAASAWDTLHPGRPWAKKCTQTRERLDIINEIIAFRGS